MNIFPSVRILRKDILPDVIRKLRLLSLIVLLPLPSPSFGDEDGIAQTKGKPTKNCEFKMDKQNDGKHPWELLKTNRKFRTKYLNMLEQEGWHDDWLESLDGPADKNSLLMINGQEFIYLRSCKIHDCLSNHIHILYSMRNGSTYGLLFENSRLWTLGGASGCIQKTLETLDERIYQ